MENKLPDLARTFAEHGTPYSINFTFHGRVRGTWTETEMRNALARLGLRHPMLASRVGFNASNEPVITTEGVPPIPLRIIERIDDEHWMREVERELPIGYDHRVGPPFRCVWIRGNEVSDLVLVCDHVTADGRAGVYALRDLLALLADPHLTLEPRLPILLSELVPDSIKPGLEKIIAEALKNGPPPSEQNEPYVREVSPDPLQVQAFSLSAEETAALVTRCRAEGVTVHAALCAAFLMAYAEKDPDQPIRAVETPVDIRPRLSQPLDDVYGDYVSLVFTWVNCSAGRSLWDIARDAAQDLANITDERALLQPFFISWVSKEPVYIPEERVIYDLSISNLGRLNIPVAYGNLELEAVHGPTYYASHPGHRVLGVNTHNGQLRATFISSDSTSPGILKRALELLSSMLQ